MNNLSNGRLFIFSLITQESYMAVTQKYVDMDEYFRFTDGDKIIINHLSYLDSDDMEFIQDKLTTVYNGDTISTIPSCDCGELVNRYLVGITCQECGTVCVDPKDKTKPILWFEILDKSLLFINPAYWNSVVKALSTKMDPLQWLSDPSYVPKCAVPNYLLLVKDQVLGGTRGYYELITNFEKVLDYFINSTELKSKTTYKDIIKLRNIYTTKKSDILSSHLPILNKKLFVVENTTKGKYINLVLGDMIDVITTWLRASGDGVSFNKKSIATGSVIAKLAALYIKYYHKFLITKPGSFRKHTYGARSHFTFRTVISAAKGKHKHNEIIAPWAIALTTFRPHMMNKLFKRGYNYKNADALLNRSIMTHHPLLEELQAELVSESPYDQGLPVLVNRNQHTGSSL